MFRLLFIGFFKLLNMICRVAEKPFDLLFVPLLFGRNLVFQVCSWEKLLPAPSNTPGFVDRLSLCRTFSTLDGESRFCV